MKLISFLVHGETHIGIVIENTVIDLNVTSAKEAGPLPKDMVAFLALGEPALNRAREIVRRFEKGDPTIAVIPLNTAGLLAPLPHPPKIIMGGRNYLSHIQEMRDKGLKIPTPPFPHTFSKYHTCVVGPGKPVIYPKISKMLDFEGELTVVIGKPGRRVKEEDAYDYIAGYTIVNDVTARDLQGIGERELSKNFETFAPMGPWIVTADEIPNPHNLTLRTYINDKFVSEAKTSDMLFNIPQYIAFTSTVYTLEPGDIIATGSPPGPVRFQDPSLMPKIGDIMRIEIEKIGTLENPIVAPGEGGWTNNP